MTSNNKVLLRGQRANATALLMTLIVLGGFAPAATARTITVTDDDADLMAAIAQDAPKQSWAAYPAAGGVQLAAPLHLAAGRSFLLRYALKIPPGQRITKAEWIIPVTAVSGNQPQVAVYRLQAAWGAGVNYEFRQQRPQPIAWESSGARGSGADRAVRPTALVPVVAAREATINVTGDVELWYEQAAPNHGWLLTVEEGATSAQFPSPLVDGKGRWKLRITYEPR